MGIRSSTERSRYVDARVDRVSGNFVFGRLFEEPHHPTVAVGLHHAVSAWVHHTRRHDGSVRLVLLMELDDFAKIGIREDISVEYEGRIVNQVFGGLERARSPAREVLVGVAHGYAEFHAIPKDVGDLPRLIGEAQYDLGKAGALDVIDLEEQKRDVRQRNDRLGDVQRQRPEMSPFPARENECLDQLRISSIE